MKGRPASKEAPVRAPTRRTGVVLAVLGIALACLAAYHNSFSGPFIYDDKDAIVNNASIRQLSTAWSSVSDEANTAGGRPVLNVSLALSYALSRNQPWGFHAVNLLIHVLAALALFGLLKRTLAGSKEVPSRFPPRLIKEADLAAFAVALLWVVHPIQTESVTYMVQRAESLMGLFYLLTLYCFVRGAQQSGHSRVWFGLAVASCFLGMGTKEDMVTAPVLVLLYDSIFMSASFSEAFRKRKTVYLGLAGSWILLAILVASTGGNRGGSIGFGIGVSPFAYALTQFKAIATYLYLSIWPNPLVFEYGTFWVKSASEVVGYAAIVLVILCASGWALVSNPASHGKRALGFAGAWFFLILAPTSSIVPGTTQMIVEHRMYLSLAAVLAVIVFGAFSLGGRKALWALILLAVPLVIVTEARNAAYKSEETLWADTAVKRPSNARAQLNYGVALLDLQEPAAALPHFQETLKLDPTSVEAETDIGTAFHNLGQDDQALARYEEALRINPEYVQARIDLGNLLTQLGRLPEGIAQYRLALKSKPSDANAHNSLGLALLSERDPKGALAEFQESIRLNPDFAPSRFNEGNAFRNVGRMPEAMAAYREALRLKADYPEASMNLGNLYLQNGQLDLAIQEFQGTLRSHPDLADVHNSLGVVFMRSRRFPEAVEEFNQAIRINPSLAAAHGNLASSLHALGRDQEAHEQLGEAARLQGASQPPGR